MTPTSLPPTTPPTAIRPYAPWAAGLRAAVVLALLVLAARVLYLWLACPYTLVEDEASYWTWAKRPELSYYSKGPGIAWLLRLSTHFLGDTMFAVRLPAAIISSITAILVAGFTNDVVGPRERRAGFFAACCFLLAPMFQTTSMVATIDGPYSLCWIAASWAAWRAFAPLRESRRASRFVLVAFLVGLGFVFKYTIVLLVPGLLVFAWRFHRGVSLPSGRSRWAQALWILVGVLVFGAWMSPVLIWNWQHHWPTVSHLLGHAGLPGGDVATDSPWSYSPLWMLEFLVVQAGSVGPVSLLILLGVLHSRKTWATDPTRRTRDLFLLCCGLPTIAFYFATTLVSKVQANWTLAGYLPLLAFAGSTIASSMDEWKHEVGVWLARPRERRFREGWFRRRPQSFAQLLWNATAIVGVVSALGMLRLDLVSVALERLKTTPVVSAFIPSKLTIPLGRFTGADRMGQHAGELLQRLKDRRPREPFVLTQHYGRAAQLEFYMPGHPLVYCASAFVPGGRRTQYDYWPATDLRTAMQLLGGDALIVGGYQVEDWLPFFEKVELLGRLDGDGKPDRPAFYGYGFRGVGAAVAKMKSDPRERSTPLPNYPSAPRAIPLTPPQQEGH